MREVGRWEGKGEGGKGARNELRLRKVLVHTRYLVGTECSTHFGFLPSLRVTMKAKPESNQL